MIIYGKNEMEYISKQSEEMEKLVLRFGHLEKGQVSDVFESIVIHIIGQMLSMNVSQRIIERLYKKVGVISPYTIEKLTIDDLCECGISRNKGNYILGLAKEVLDGRISFDILDKLSDEEVIKYLMRIKGVGRWTAEMVA